MYFASFTYKDKENYGILSNDKKKVIPIENILNKTNNEVPDNLLDFIRTYSDTLIPELNLMIDDDGISIEDIKINAPIPYPRRNIFCLGKNYAEHAVEIKSLPGNTAGIPEYPIYFTKIADPAIGYGDKIMVPEDITTHLDYKLNWLLL